MSEQTFLLPDLGEGLTEAEIVRWLVAEGDVVAVDQAIVEVETAKSVVEVPSPYAGTVSRLHGAEGETREVGLPLISVTAPATSTAGSAAETYREEEKAGSGNVLIGYGTSAPSPAGRRRRSRTAPQTTAPTAPPTAPPTGRNGASAPVAAPVAAGAAPLRVAPLVLSPVVRQFARSNGVDLRQVKGTGGGGLITRGDVQGAIAQVPASPAPVPQLPMPEVPASLVPAPAPAPAAERRIPLSNFRKAVSTSLSRSRAEIPEATVWVDVDATALVELREKSRTARDPGPGLLAYLARFVVAALKLYPVLNGRLDTERQEIVEYDHINLGIAVQTDRGLVVPAVLGAQQLTTARLDAEIRGLTARARAGRASHEELTTGTFTLNNYGGFNVDGSAAIINHPQVAILGLGRIIDRPWVVDGEITVRKITQMSFVFDHRVCDGGTAAGFIRAVADAMENPASAIARL